MLKNRVFTDRSNGDARPDVVSRASIFSGKAPQLQQQNNSLL